METFYTLYIQAESRWWQLYMERKMLGALGPPLND